MILYPPQKKSLWPRIIIFFFFLLAIFVNLVFLIKPENFYHLAFGNFQLGSYRNGLGIFENHRFHNFYSLSPYNDYLIVNNQKIQLWSTDDDQTQLQIKFSPAWHNLVTEIFKNYFFSPAVNYSFKNKDIKLVYRAEKINDQCLLITKTISVKNQQNLQKIGTTFSFNDTDFVFSPSTFQLYSNNSQEDLSVFTNVYQQNLSLSSIYTEPVLLSDSAIALKSLDNSGFLLVKIDPSQKFMIDQLNRLLILESSVLSDSSTIHFQVCSFSNFEELKATNL